MEGNPIGIRIAEVIEELGLKRIRFAERIGVSTGYVSQLCAGDKEPSDRTIRDICRAYNVNEVWLRTGEGEMFLQRTRQDEIASFLGGLLGDNYSEFQARLVAALAVMTPEEWALLERKVDEIAGRIHGDQEGGNET